MKLELNQVEKGKRAGEYKLSVRYGDHDAVYRAKISTGPIRAVEYDEELSSILHQNLGDAKRFNSLVFKILDGKDVELPAFVGEF